MGYYCALSTSKQLSLSKCFPADIYFLDVSFHYDYEHHQFLKYGLAETGKPQRKSSRIKCVSLESSQMWWTPKARSLLCSKFLVQWKHKTSKIKGTTGICLLWECLVQNGSFSWEERSTWERWEKFVPTQQPGLEHPATILTAWPSQRSLVNGRPCSHLP